HRTFHRTPATAWPPACRLPHGLRQPEDQRKLGVPHRQRIAPRVSFFPGVDSAGLRDDDPRCQPDKERPVLILALLQLAATAAPAPAPAPVRAATVAEYLLP